MDGILLINKEKNLTSRDVVNKLMKILNTKKIGHAGTLDPLATGLLVIGVGKGTKILDLLTLDTKEYIAVVKMGIQTNTLDITGDILKITDNINLSKEHLIDILKSYQKSYEQTVPKYSAVKINGKKLYEYARSNQEIELPKRLVNIFNIELLNYDPKNNDFTFKTLVSKGTYIRSLIDDIGKSLNINCTMKDLIRIKSGKFLIQDSFKLNEKLSFIKIEDALDFPKVIIENEILKKVQNGNLIYLDKKDKYITLLDKNNQIQAIYQKTENNIYKAFKVF